MRTFCIALVFGAVAAVPAGAVEYRIPVIKQLFTCGTGGVSRVAAPAHPAACCDGQLKCAEFLSTAGRLRPMRDPRT